MQSDGRFVISSATNSTLWQSSSLIGSESLNPVAFIQDDANF
jgi:hypothetical protein